MNKPRETAEYAWRSREHVLAALQDAALSRPAREELGRMKRDYAQLARTADRLAASVERLARIAAKENNR